MDRPALPKGTMGIDAAEKNNIIDDNAETAEVVKNLKRMLDKSNMRDRFFWTLSIPKEQPVLPDALPYKRAKQSLNVDGKQQWMSVFFFFRVVFLALFHGTCLPLSVDSNRLNVYILEAWARHSRT